MPKISSIHSAVSIEHRLVTSTDSQTDRHSAVASNRASIAPRGKKNLHNATRCAIFVCTGEVQCQKGCTHIRLHLVCRYHGSSQPWIQRHYGNRGR